MPIPWAHTRTIEGGQMTAEELIRHTFPWELAPGVPADAIEWQPQADAA